MRDLPGIVAFARAVAGRSFAERELTIRERDAFTVVELGAELVAFVAHDETARARLAKERRVLARVAPRVSFAVPRPVGAIEGVDPCDLRARVAGATGRVFEERLARDAALAGRIAIWIADALLELHASLTTIELDAFDLDAPEWPFDAGRLRAAASRALEGDDLARAHEICARWDARLAARRPRDDVLLHADFGLHNLTFDAATGTPLGVFDFHDAARGPRAFDLKLLPSYGEAFLNAVLERYAARGPAIDDGDIHLVHAATALSSLATRGGPPNAEARAWARGAVRAFFMSSSER